MNRNQQVLTIGIVISVLGIIGLCWVGTRLFFGECILLNCPPSRTFTVLELGLPHNLFPQDSFGNPIHRPSGKLGAQDSGIMTIYWRQGNGLAVYNVWEYGTEKLASNLYQALRNDGENLSNHISLSYQSELADEQNIGCGFSQFGGYRCVFIARYTEFVLSFNVTIDEEMPIEKFEEAVIYIDRQIQQKLFPE
jgi:hypothetical protein